MIFTFAKMPQGGRLSAIPSKSAAHRILICAAFADAPTKILCPVTSDDIDATARVLTALGADITRQADGFFVRPLRRDCPTALGATLDCGESGSTLRFMLPVAAMLGADVRFVRHGRLSTRPLTPLYEELRRHGAILPDDPTTEPLPVRGHLTAGEYVLSADVSSQFISGLLMAFPLSDAPCRLTLTEKIESADYIRITTAVMEKFDAAPTVSEGERHYAAAPTAYHSPGEIVVEGDWSNAAFWLAAGAIGQHPVTVTGLDIHSPQGDRRITDILSAFGAAVTVDGDAVTVSPAPLTGITFDAAQIPDLVPALSAVAAAAAGETVITGIARLRLKESDRVAAIRDMLTALGAEVTAKEDRLIICGGKALHGGTVSSVRDHRMVMCAALCTLIADGEVAVTEAESIAKSYPRFAVDFHAMGGIITEED